MKIALVAGYKDGAIDQVMRPLTNLLRDLGEDADLLGTYEDTTLGRLAGHDYDLIHCGFFRYADLFHEVVAAPMTANVWHIGIENTEKYQAFLARYDFHRIVTDHGDSMTLQQLGQMGFTNVTPIPILFAHEKFQHLQPPVGEFTVGLFGNDYPYKRYDIIIDACKRAGVKCHAVITPDQRKHYFLDPVRDVYSQVHVMAHATFVDTNSLPMREALLCGRPVLATYSGGLAQVLRDGENGYWYDGSVTDLADKIVLAKENYAKLVDGACQTRMPSSEETARAYQRMFHSVVEKADAVRSH